MRLITSWGKKMCNIIMGQTKQFTGNLIQNHNEKEKELLKHYLKRIQPIVYTKRISPKNRLIYSSKVQYTQHLKLIQPVVYTKRISPKNLLIYSIRNSILSKIERRKRH